MKRLFLFHLILTGVFLFNYNSLNAQRLEIEEITLFSSRIKSPIKMDIKQNGNSIIFNVINRSFYTYEFKIKFDQFENLSPRIFEKEVLLHPGSNKLFELKSININESVNYSYTTEYILGSKNYKAEISYPYVSPVGNNRVANFLSTSENGKVVYKINHFKMNTNDTVFCIRKGIVTALPESIAEIDRIVNFSIEVLHIDGTVAIYRGIAPSSSKINLGQTVYPGQPLGQIGEHSILILNVCSFQGNGKTQNLKIYFADDNEQLISSELILDKSFAYSPSIIKREMTKKESKKYDNSELY